jgi:RNA polymerase sigma-70 factor (ECF subfamily)
MINDNKDRHLSDPDNELMRKVGSGDKTAFEQLVQRHQRLVTGIIYRYTGNHHEVEDLAQDIFLKVYKAATRYVPRAQFKTWLYKVVANHCFNYFRSQKRRSFITSYNQSFPEEDNPPLHYAEAQKKQPENILQQQELRTALKVALSELPDRQRMALILHRFEDLSYKEIANVLGCSFSAVESLLFRAMSTLKKKLHSAKPP